MPVFMYSTLHLWFSHTNWEKCIIFKINRITVDTRFTQSKTAFTIRGRNFLKNEHHGSIEEIQGQHAVVDFHKFEFGGIEEVEFQMEYEEVYWAQSEYAKTAREKLRT